MASGLNGEVEAFLGEYISSIEELEILLLLYRKRPAAIAIEAIDAELKSSLSSIQGRLENLGSRNLIGVEGQNFFYQSSPDRDHVVAFLEQDYLHRRLKVIEAIYSKPITPLKHFSDAFKIRKEKKNG